MKRRTPIKRTAIRRRLPKDFDEARAFREAVIERAGGRCQICPILIGTDDDEAIRIARRCSGMAVQAHHRLPRGMGGHGSNDPKLGLAACLVSHDFVERHRALAYRYGLLLRHTVRSSYD